MARRIPTNVSRETMTERFLIVAMDGPGGVGKSSVGRALCARRGFFFLSSGQIYRAMAWHALRHGWDGAGAVPEDALAGFDLRLGGAEGPLLDGEPLGDRLVTEEVAKATSILSTQPLFRERANTAQRDVVARMRGEGVYNGVIVEGRDIGTVVFPDAPLKIYLTARPEVRAQRRFAELCESQPGLTLEAVTSDLLERDRRDMERALAPLRPAEDAREVDTSELDMEGVVAALEALVEEAEKLMGQETPGA